MMGLCLFEFRKHPRQGTRTPTHGEDKTGTSFSRAKAKTCSISNPESQLEVAQQDQSDVVAPFFGFLLHFYSVIHDGAQEGQS